MTEAPQPINITITEDNRPLAAQSSFYCRFVGIPTDEAYVSLLTFLEKARTKTHRKLRSPRGTHEGRTLSAWIPLPDTLDSILAKMDECAMTYTPDRETLLAKAQSTDAAIER